MITKKPNSWQNQFESLDQDQIKISNNNKSNIIGEIEKTRNNKKDINWIEKYKNS